MKKRRLLGNRLRRCLLLLRRCFRMRQWGNCRRCNFILLIFAVIFVLLRQMSYDVGQRAEGMLREGGRGDTAEIGIVTIASQAYQEKYVVQRNTVRCYAERHGYAHLLMTGTEYASCLMLSGFYKRKLCTVLEVLRRNPQLKVLSIQDIDVAVLYPERRLEDYLKELDVDQEHDLYLLDRHTGEWAAGIYLVRNTAWSQQFLEAWLRILGGRMTGVLNSLRNGLYTGSFRWFGNEDNGALHLSLLRQVFPQETAASTECERKRLAATTSVEYAAFVKCVRSAYRKWAPSSLKSHVHEVAMQESYTGDAFFSREDTTRGKGAFVYTFRGHPRLIMLHGVKYELEDEFWDVKSVDGACVQPKLKRKVRVMDLSRDEWNNFFQRYIHQAYPQYKKWRRSIDISDNSVD